VLRLEAADLLERPPDRDPHAGEQQL